QGLLGVLDQASALPRSCQVSTGLYKYHWRAHVAANGKLHTALPYPFGGESRVSARAPSRRLTSGRGQAEIWSAGGLLWLVDQAVGSHDEVIPELFVVLLGQLKLIQRGAHVPQPGVPLSRPDMEPHVPHPQPWMPAQLVIRGGATPVLDQEQ